MTTLDVTVRTQISRSSRARQLEGMFDVPPASVHELSWRMDVPLDEKPWQLGLIVGPSGSGKSTVLRELFGDERELSWDGASVVDSFDASHGMTEIASACQAVGFNTIPAWLRPYSVLSNGERFRASMARLLLEAPDSSTVVVDEFTSVVDRQVAQIGAAAVAKHVRRHPGLRFVAATCHYDVVDWLQPDWIIEPALREFRWRSVHRRPELSVTVAPVDYSAWQLFAPFHYLTAELNKAARCFVLFVGDQPAAFAGVLHRPHAKATDIKGVSRLVTLPDWQGLGLAFVLVDTLGAAYKASGYRLRTYPAHPALVHGFDRSSSWSLRQRPSYAGSSGVVHGPNAKLMDRWRAGSRPCAVFEYVGDADDDPIGAAQLVGAKTRSGGLAGRQTSNPSRKTLKVAQKRSLRVPERAPAPGTSRRSQAKR